MLFLQKDLQETKKITNFAVNYRTIAKVTNRQHPIYQH